MTSEVEHSLAPYSDGSGSLQNICDASSAPSSTFGCLLDLCHQKVALKSRRGLPILRKISRGSTTRESSNGLQRVLLKIGHNIIMSLCVSI